MEQTKRDINTENLIKSRKRVKDFAEVYTPNWLVKDMVALAKASEIETTILEPACGNGNFLAEILEQKLKKGYTEYHAWTALKSIYGIDIQEDNVKECKERLCNIFLRYLPWYNKEDVMPVLDNNIVCGNFLTKKHYENGNEIDKFIWFLDDEPRLL